MLGEPALVVGHHRGDAQRVALLAQQGVAAVARAEAPDLTCLGEVGDVLGLVARPRDVGLARLQRGADGVQGRNEAVARRAVEQRQDRGTHPRHDLHRRHDVLGVRDLHAEERLLSVEGAHAERDDVHRPAAHAPPVEVGHQRLHPGRVHPVVGGTGVGLVDRADVGGVLDPRDVVGVGRGPERVGLLRLVQLDERAGLDELGRHAIPLLVGAVAPDDAIGLGQLRHVADPGQQPRVLGRRSVDPWHGCCSHIVLCSGRRPDRGECCCPPGRPDRVC